MKFNQFFNETPKYYNVLAGLALGAFGVLILLVCIFIFGVLTFDYSPKEKPILIFGIIMFPVGIQCLIISYKLLSNSHKSREKGLFSPIFLIVFGFLFLICPIILIPKNAGLTLDAVTSFGAGIACFVLAKIRYDKNKSLL